MVIQNLIKNIPFDYIDKRSRYHLQNDWILKKYSSSTELIVVIVSYPYRTILITVLEPYLISSTVSSTVRVRYGKVEYGTGTVRYIYGKVRLGLGETKNSALVQ